MEALTKDSFAALSTAEQMVHLEQVDARTRQRLILSARNSLSLTRALSSEKLFYTLKEIGLADAVDLLALAAPEQIRDMVDLDCWRKDTLDDRRLLTWLMLLDEAGSSKLAEWALHVDSELLVLLVKRYVEVVRKAEIEDDPTFDQSRYFTFDDHYLLRFVGEEEPILAILLERIRVLDYDMYKHILEWSLLELDSTLEEDTLRWRNARLADRGYPSYQEAQELFRFVAPESFSLAPYQRSSVVAKVRYAADEELIPADHALMLISGGPESLLTRALARVPLEYIEHIGQELAILTNETAVAKACDLGEVAEVRRCAEEVHDYVNIGLAYLAHENEMEAIQLLLKILLRPFFRVGVSVTIRLRNRACEIDSVLRRRVGERWEEWLDSPFREVCAHARRQPPAFFRGLDTPGEIFTRRFRTLAEVKQVETVLQYVPVWFEVLQRWGIVSASRFSEQVSLARLWNTAFARWVITGQIGMQPLKRGELKLLQETLPFSSLENIQARFLSFMTAQAPLTDEETVAIKTLASFAQALLSELLTVEAETADFHFLDGVLLND